MRKNYIKENPRHRPQKYCSKKWSRTKKSRSTKKSQTYSRRKVSWNYSFCCFWWRDISRRYCTDYSRAGDWFCIFLHRNEESRKTTRRDILLFEWESKSCMTLSWCFDRFPSWTPETSPKSLSEARTRMALSSHTRAPYPCETNMGCTLSFSETHKKYLRLIGVFYGYKLSYRWFHELFWSNTHLHAGFLHVFIWDNWAHIQIVVPRKGLLRIFCTLGRAPAE